MIKFHKYHEKHESSKRTPMNIVISTFSATAIAKKGSGTHVRGSAGTWAQRIIFVFLRPVLMRFHLTR